MMKQNRIIEQQNDVKLENDCIIEGWPPIWPGDIPQPEPIWQPEDPEDD